MRKLLLVIAALLFSATAHAHVSAVPFPEIGSLQDVTHRAAFAIFQTYAGPPQIACNLVTGVAPVGGPCTATTTCNGTGDDAPAFKAANTWARANQGSSNQVVLTIPNGSNCVFNSSQSYPGTIITNAIASGIKNLIVEATGATLTAGSVGYNLGTGAVICHKGLTDVAGCSARIQSVSAGATQVTLTAASFSAGYISRFSVGQWLLFGGLDIQGLWNSTGGYPPNNNFFEWRKVTNICNNTTGCTGTAVITLDRALSNSYLSTWPSYNTGDAFEADPGGPATIWAIDSTWDATLDYRGFTVAQAAQNYAEGRNIILRNVTPTGCCGLVPSQNETFTAYNSNWSITSSPGWEVDKFVGTITLDTVTIPRVDFQSSSTDLLVMRNSTIGSQFGTPKSAQITDTSWSGTFRPGAWTNGVSYGSITCTRCAVTTFDFDGGMLQNRTADYSMSGGVISFANTNASSSDPDQRIFVPNTNIFYSATGYLSIGLFKSQTVTQDPTNTFIQTNEAGGFPLGAGTGLFLTSVFPQFTCDACTGDATLIATNIQNGATALAPLGQYGFRSYAPVAAPGSIGSLKNKGKLTSLTIDVTQAYTGSGALTLNSTGQFHNFNMDQSGWVQYDWVPQINLKQAGTRVITPSGVTCNDSPGVCAGDVCVQPVSGCFTPPSTMWIAGGIDPYINGTLSGGVNPLFTMTLRTNQGIIP